MKISYAVACYASPDGKRRVVALGETHLKLAEASAVGKEIVQQFALRGVETFQARRVVAGRLLYVLIHVPRLVVRFLSLGAVRGSTITDAKRAAAGTTVELEVGDRSPLGLHVASVYLSLFFVTGFSVLGLELAPWLVPASDVAITRLLWWLAPLVLALELHFLALIPAWVLRQNPWSWLIHPAIAIVSLRDVLLASGTVRMLEAHPEIPDALVIMGRAHLPGYGRELVERHGFRRVET
jgi:Fe2+ transport system protein FeoA